MARAKQIPSEAEIGFIDSHFMNEFYSTIVASELINELSFWNLHCRRAIGSEVRSIDVQILIAVVKKIPFWNRHNQHANLDWCNEHVWITAEQI